MYQARVAGLVHVSCTSARRTASSLGRTSPRRGDMGPVVQAGSECAPSMDALMGSQRESTLAMRTRPIILLLLACNPLAILHDINSSDSSRAGCPSVQFHSGQGSRASLLVCYMAASRALSQFFAKFAFLATLRALRSQC